jgi:hypothetical protein
MPNLPYATMAIASTRATVKVWDTVGGTVDPPGGSAWREVGYDDSGWDDPVLPTFTNTDDPNAEPQAYTTNGYGPHDTPEAFAPWSTPPAGTPTNPTQFLWRWHIDVPDASWFPFRIELYSWFSSALLVYGNNDRTVLTTITFGSEEDAFASALPFTPGTSLTLIGTDTFDSGFGIADMWDAARIVFYQPDSISSGVANAWGTPALSGSDHGVLGVGDTTAHLIPTICTGGLTNVASIASNGKTTLFLTADGSIYGMGDNSQGMALADGTTDTLDHSTPTLLSYGLWDFPFQDVSIGQECAFALDRAGNVWGWGPNTSGSLGLGNTTSRTTPTLITADANAISCGKNFSAFATYSGATANFARVTTAGDNSYGQLGDGTTSNAISGTHFDLTSPTSALNMIVSQVSAGEDQLLVLASDNFNQGYVYGCGRAEYGSLGWTAWNTGSGAHKIKTTPTSISVPIVVVQVEQAGPLSFFHAGTLDYEIAVFGDGTPYGGSGDDGFNPATSTWQNYPPTTIYGTGTHTAAGHVYQHVLSFFSFPFTCLGIASSGAGSQNPYSVGNSEAVFAAFGLTNDGTTFDDLLYTWGWGGAGQMGSGADPTTNPAPVSINGLTGVIGVCVAEGIMFAISTIGAVPTLRRGSRAFAQVIGD